MSLPATHAASDATTTSTANTTTIKIQAREPHALGPWLFWLPLDQQRTLSGSCCSCRKQRMALEVEEAVIGQRGHAAPFGKHNGTSLTQLMQV